jgi:hypothetical protein
VDGWAAAVAAGQGRCTPLAVDGADSTKLADGDSEELGPPPLR